LSVAKEALSSQHSAFSWETFEMVSIEKALSRKGREGFAKSAKKRVAKEALSSQHSAVSTQHSAGNWNGAHRKALNREGREGFAKSAKKHVELCFARSDSRGACPTWLNADG
jgi:hypothetical protein